MRRSVTITHLKSHSISEEDNSYLNDNSKQDFMENNISKISSSSILISTTNLDSKFNLDNPFSSTNITTTSIKSLTNSTITTTSSANIKSITHSKAHTNENLDISLMDDVIDDDLEFDDKFVDFNDKDYFNQSQDSIHETLNSSSFKKMDLLEQSDQSEHLEQSCQACFQLKNEQTLFHAHAHAASQMECKNLPLSDHHFSFTTALRNRNSISKSIEIKENDLDHMNILNLNNLNSLASSLNTELDLTDDSILEDNESQLSEDYFDDEGEDILPFEGIRYTIYEEGSQQHHLQVMESSYKKDKTYFETMFRFGLADLELNYYFHHISLGSDSPELLKKGMETFNTNKLESFHYFYRCLTTEDLPEKAKVISLLGIFFIYGSSKWELRRRFPRSNSTNLFSQIENKRRSFSTAGLPMKSQNNILSTLQVTNEMEQEIATQLIRYANRCPSFSFQVAELYRLGRGVKIDPYEAYKWYNIAYDKYKHKTSCVAIGLCHINGYGCIRNVDIAKKYFTNAYRNQDFRAKKFLNRCNHLIESEKSLQSLKQSTKTL